MQSRLVERTVLLHEYLHEIPSHVMIVVDATLGRSSSVGPRVGDVSCFNTLCSQTGEVPEHENLKCAITCSHLSD